MVVGYYNNKVQKGLMLKMDRMMLPCDVDEKFKKERIVMDNLNRNFFIICSFLIFCGCSTSNQEKNEKIQNVDQQIEQLLKTKGQSQDYQEVSFENKKKFYYLVSNILKGNLSGQRELANALNFSYSSLKDEYNNQIVALKSLNHGLYLFYLKPQNDVIIQAVHPFFDVGTAEQALYLFKKLKPRALFLASVHRCSAQKTSQCSGQTAVCGGGKTSFRISDLAHNSNTYFFEAHKAAYDLNRTSLTVQLHAKKAKLPDMILSNGLNGFYKNSFSNILAKRMVGQGRIEAVSCNDIGGANYHLCGTTNVLGRYSNGSINACEIAASVDQKRFLHIEQGQRIFEQKQLWNILVDTIKERVKR